MVSLYPALSPLEISEKDEETKQPADSVRCTYYRNAQDEDDDEATTEYDKKVTDQEAPRCIIIVAPQLTQGEGVSSSVTM